jgi:hypothetical protein
MLGSLNICSIRGGDGQLRPYEHRRAPFQEGLTIRHQSKEAAMKLRMKLLLGLAVLSLSLVPGAAVANGVDYQPEGPKYQPETPKGPKTAPKGKAYGYYCRGQSKKHVKGEKGTAFSRCVKAMARADKNANLHPKKACKALSKKHVKDEKGTPFSRCVKAANQMRKEQRATVTTSAAA